MRARGPLAGVHSGFRWCGQCFEVWLHLMRGSEDIDYNCWDFFYHLSYRYPDHEGL